MVYTLKKKLKRSPVTRTILTVFRPTRDPAAIRTNLVMFHPGRCGSAVVGKMLNQHPAVYWASEIFERMSDIHKDVTPGPEALRTVIERSRRQCLQTPKGIYGFALKHLPQQHLRPEWINMDLEPCVELLRELRFTKFIVLQRENYLRRAISAEIGKQNQQWHAKANPEKATRIRIDLDAFRTGTRREPLLELFRCLDEYQERLTRLLPAADTLHLSYEKDILEDPRKAYFRACEFLGIVPQSPQVRLARTNPFSYDDMVDNMRDVSAALKNTKYEWMLNA